MPTYFTNYDATSAYKLAYDLAMREKSANTDKPRLLEQSRQKRALVLTLFSEFVNHVLSLKYPDKEIQYFDIVDAQEILKRLPHSGQFGKRQGTTIENVWALMSFEDSTNAWVSFTIKAGEKE